MRAKHAAVICLLLGLSATPAAAVIGTYVSYGSSDPVSSANQSGTGSAALVAVLPNARIRANAAAATGHLTAATSTIASATGGNRGGSAAASFEAQLTILSGALGSSGTATFLVRLSAMTGIAGSASPVFSPSTGAAAQIQLVGGGVHATEFDLQATQSFNIFHTMPLLVRSGYLHDDAHPNGHFFTPAGAYDFNDIYALSVSYISGTPFTVAANINCSGSVPRDGTAFCSTSLSWRGLSSVIDGHGDQIAATTFSGSGFNYGSFVPGVPEPSAWTLLIMGFGLTGVARRRRTVAAA